MALTNVRNGQYVKYRSGDMELAASLSEPTTAWTRWSRSTPR